MCQLMLIYLVKRFYSIKENVEVLLPVPSSSRGRQLLCKLLSHRLNGGLNHDIKIGNKFFESVAMLKYFGTTLNKS